MAVVESTKKIDQLDLKLTRLFEASPIVVCTACKHNNLEDWFVSNTRNN